MTFAERMAGLRRLMVLQLLAENRATAWSLFILRDALKDLHHEVTVSEMAELADWLAAAGLVKFVTREVPPLLRITSNGVETAAGRHFVKGVDEPLT